MIAVLWINHYSNLPLNLDDLEGLGSGLTLAAGGLARRIRVTTFDQIPRPQGVELSARSSRLFALAVARGSAADDLRLAQAKHQVRLHDAGDGQCRSISSRSPWAAPPRGDG